MAEMYKTYRPNSFKEIIGQESAVKILNEFGKANRVPHSILFTGPSGCGKTTLARILRTKLRCGDPDFFEMNCADFRGIDMIRDVRGRMGAAPMSGPCRVWLIDEMHQMTTQAQEAMLKLLEDTPEHVYFFLCTTDPAKLKTAIKTRCTEIKVRALTQKECIQLVTDIADKVEASVDEDVAIKIAKLCNGSARKALVLLDSVRGLKSEDQLHALEANDSESEGIDICRMLFNQKATWADYAAKLKTFKGESEQLRWAVLGYAKSVMFSGKDLDRCHLILTAFRDPFYDSKEAGLAAACYEVFRG